MKFLTIFITSILLSAGSFAKSGFVEGFSSPQAAINAFLTPLKKGKAGVSEAMKASQGLNGESSEDSQIAQTLTKDMKEQGKVVKYKEIDTYSRLGGNMQKFTYEVEYASGKKRELSFTILRPASNSGFYITSMNAE